MTAEPCRAQFVLTGCGGPVEHAEAIRAAVASITVMTVTHRNLRIVAPHCPAYGG
jgi:hypothetical protein